MNTATHASAADIAVERHQSVRARGRLARLWASNAPGYLFLLPWLLGFFGLTLGPALVSLYLSFTDFDLIRAPQWTGAANYVRIATADPKFAAAMQVTLTYVVLSVPFKLAFALLVAIALNRGMSGLTFYRAIFYLPSLLGAQCRHRRAVAPAVRRRRPGQRSSCSHVRHRGPELDLPSELLALDAGRP